jgi:hypothetical protein
VRGHYLFVFPAFPIWLFARVQGLEMSRVALAFVLLAPMTPAIMAGKVFTLRWTPIAGQP